MNLDLTSVLMLALGAALTFMTRVYFSNNKTVFKRIDENKEKIETVKDKLNKDYHDKREIQEYIDLLQQPILQRMNHIDLQLTELKALVKSLIEKTE